MQMHEDDSPNARDARQTEGLEETFPASDPPSSSEPGGGITGAEDPAVREARANRIRERAHSIWQGEGEVHGRHEDHWSQAEREIDAEDAKAKTGSVKSPR
jgi:Protein of unknown function (DUF2934)